MKDTDNTAVALPTRIDDEESIDIIEILMTLLDKWQIILLSLLIGMLLFNAYAFFCIEPKYQSTAKLYVVSASGDSAVDLTDLNIGTSLTNDYKELIMSYPVLDEVIQSMGLDMTSDELSGLISISNPSNTRVLTITATTTDAKFSQTLANTLAGVAQEYLPETMSTPRPNVAQVAKEAHVKSSPSYLRMTLLGGIIGLLIAAGYFVLKFVTDDTIRTPDEMEKAFGIPVITSIPENEAMHLNDGIERKERRKK